MVFMYLHRKYNCTMGKHIVNTDQLIWHSSKEELPFETISDMSAIILS